MILHINPYIGLFPILPELDLLVLTENWTVWFVRVKNYSSIDSNTKSHSHSNSMPKTAVWNFDIEEVNI